MRQPAEYADEIEREPALPAGSEERFSGYGVMGLPFRSGHILGLRRFWASSIGPGYRSVWHRAPSGRWTFYQDQPATSPARATSGRWSRRFAKVRSRSRGRGHVASRSAPAAASWRGPWSSRRRRSPARSTESPLCFPTVRGTRRFSRPCRALRACAARGPRAPDRPRTERTALRRHPLRIWVARESSANCKAPDLGVMGPAPEQGNCMTSLSRSAACLSWAAPSSAEGEAQTQDEIHGEDDRATIGVSRRADTVPLNAMP